MSATTLPKLVRQMRVVEDARDAEWAEAETRERAMKYAKEQGIVNPHITAFWQPHYLNNFTEYPMYLLGPGAPKIETCEDALRHSPRAQFTVLIREQEVSETNPT